MTVLPRISKRVPGLANLVEPVDACANSLNATGCPRHGLPSSYYLTMSSIHTQNPTNKQPRLWPSLLAVFLHKARKFSPFSSVCCTIASLFFNSSKSLALSCVTAWSSPRSRIFVSTSISAYSSANRSEPRSS